MKKEKQKKITRGLGYSLIRPILKLYSLICLRPKIVGKKNLPKGGYILAGTHLSYYDPVVIGNITMRPIHFLAKKELMDKKVLGSILSFMGIIRVDRSTKNPEAKKEAIDALHADKVVCVFPEGTCNKTGGDLLPFKYGAVSFASKSGKPIVPFAIIGKPKPFNYKTKVIIGKPMYVQDEDLEKANNLLMEIVRSLIKENRNEK